MSKLRYDFDLCYDIKSTEQLDLLIRKYDDPAIIMKMMLVEIQERDLKISELEEAAVMSEIVSKAHQELVGELMVPSVKHDEKDADGSYPPIILNADTQVFAKEGDNTSFCRFCGAGIPHRVGEGRCGKCMHHFHEPDELGRDTFKAKGEQLALKDDTTVDADQALADVVAMDTKKTDDPWSK